MPQNQDPYGSHAYRQRIFKEMQSAINFRQIQRCGGYRAAPYATTGDPYFLRETIPSSSSLNRFTLHAPYSYVDREGQTLLVPASTKVAPTQQQQQGEAVETHSRKVVPPISAAATNDAYLAPIAQRMLLQPLHDVPSAPPPVPSSPHGGGVAASSPLYSGDDAASQSSTKPQLGRPLVPNNNRAKSATVLRAKVLKERQEAAAVAVVPYAVPQQQQPGGGKLPAAAGRCSSAAVSRPPLAASALMNQNNNNSGKKASGGVPPLANLKALASGGPRVRAASASVRSSGGCSTTSSTDPVVASKVAVLERTLQEERETRMRLCNQLAQLESLLVQQSPAAGAGRKQ